MHAFDNSAGSLSASLPPGPYIEVHSTASSDDPQPTWQASLSACGLRAGVFAGRPYRFCGLARLRSKHDGGSSVQHWESKRACGQRDGAQHALRLGQLPADAQGSVNATSEFIDLATKGSTIYLRLPLVHVGGTMTSWSLWMRFSTPHRARELPGTVERRRAVAPSALSSGGCQTTGPFHSRRVLSSFAPALDLPPLTLPLLLSVAQTTKPVSWGREPTKAKKDDSLLCRPFRARQSCKRECWRTHRAGGGCRRFRPAAPATSSDPAPTPEPGPP